MVELSVVLHLLVTRLYTKLRQSPMISKLLVLHGFYCICDNYKLRISNCKKHTLPSYIITNFLLNMQFELAKHHNANVIFCYFEYNPKILETFKNSYPQAKWSRLKSAWFLPDTSLYRKRLNIPLPEIGDQELVL